MLRRDALKNSLASLGALGLWTAGFAPVAASASDLSGLRNKLVAALYSINNEACIATAARLEASAHLENVRLHLRDVGLKSSDVTHIANALWSLTDAQASTLASVSLSYNKDIGDVGAVRLARALPKTLPELGLVGCNIRESGGSALLGWAEQSTRLRMLCVEGNDFPKELVKRYRALPRSRPHLNVYV